MQKSDINPVVQKLINHERNKNIRFSEGKLYYKDLYGNIATGIGIHKLLEPFVDNYKRPSLTEAKKKIGKQEWVEKKKKRVNVGDSWDKIDSIGTLENKSGRELGTLVHRQICAYSRSRHTKTFNKVCPNPHPYTMSVLSKMEEKGIQLFFGEMIIYDEVVKYLTPIDGVAINAEGKLTLIEIKTGYENIFKIGKTRMKAPFDKWFNSPLNQARLQLLIPCLTLKYRYGISVDSAWVVNVNSADVYFYPLLKSMAKDSTRIYNHLVATCGICKNVQLTKEIETSREKLKKTVKKRSVPVKKKPLLQKGKRKRKTVRNNKHVTKSNKRHHKKNAQRNSPYKRSKAFR